MPRIARPVIPGMPHHIVHRGNNRQQIFYQEKDYLFLIKSIREAKKNFDCLLYAYCFMLNHIHMILVPKNIDGLSKMLKLVAGRYTRYINKNYERTGTLWEGRFKSSPIETERYLFGCTRYIEINPVRAQIVKHPAFYRWSSYSKKAVVKNDPILDLDPYYLELGRTPEEREHAYQEWFQQAPEEEEQDFISKCIRQCLPVGSKEFVDKICQKLGKDIKIRPRGRPKKEK